MSNVLTQIELESEWLSILLAMLFGFSVKFGQQVIKFHQESRLTLQKCSDFSWKPVKQSQNVGTNIRLILELGEVHWNAKDACKFKI